MEHVGQEDLIRQVREKGLKVTPQRLAIIEVLVDMMDSHPGAHIVYKEAKKKKKSLSLSTTYATLNELSRHGIIKILQFDGMDNRYDGNVKDHINLICEQCGKIIDYPLPFSVDRTVVTRSTGFSVTDARMELYGLCHECRENGAAK